jgi:hypothetical protein
VVRSITDPVTALGMLLGSITHALHLPIGVHGMLTVTRTLGLLAALSAGGWLLVNSTRIGMVKALGTTLLLVVVLGPVVQPWYVAWGLILLAPVAFGRWRLVVIGGTILGSFIGFPGGWELIKELARASLWSMALALAVLCVVALPPVVARIRQLARMGAFRPPAPAGLGLRWPSAADEVLHQDHVEPLAELAPDLLLDAHQLEATAAVEGDRGVVAPDDAGHHGVEPVGLGQADQLGQHRLADPAPAVIRVDVHGVLDGGGVGGAGPVGGQRAEA